MSYAFSPFRILYLAAVVVAMVGWVWMFYEGIAWVFA
jgi:hypothetical protein